MIVFLSTMDRFRCGKTCNRTAVRIARILGNPRFSWPIQTRRDRLRIAEISRSSASPSQKTLLRFLFKVKRNRRASYETRRVGAGLVPSVVFIQLAEVHSQGPHEDEYSEGNNQTDDSNKELSQRSCFFTDLHLCSLPEKVLYF